MSIAHKVNGSWQKTAGLPPVDSVLSSTSQNPLENRQIYAALADKITASVSNLVNYYKKSETYTQAEVRQLIGAISTLSIKVVASLPTTDISTTTIYWVGPDATTGKYDQYIYADDAWVKTGDTSVNLGDYVTTEALELAIADFLTENDVRAILASYYTKTEVDTLLNGKQDSLTFDNAPTENSNNVVKSGGVYSAVNDVYKVMGENGAKNFVALNRSPDRTQVLTNVSVTNQIEDSVTLTSKAADYANLHLYYMLPAGQYIVSYDFESDDTSYQPAISIYDAVRGSLIQGGNGIKKNVQRIITVEETREHLDIRLFITLNNDTVVRTGTFKNLMIRLASDTDSTYQPYAKNNQQLTEDKAEQSYIDNMLGKNLIPFPYTNFGGFSSGSKYEGITYTYENDGTIVVNGTCTNTSYFSLIQGLKFPLDTTKKYTLSIETENGKASVYFGTNLTTTSTEFAVRSVENGYGEVTFTPWTNSYTRNTLAIYVVAGTYDNLRIKVMLRYAENKDPSYVPYDSRTSQTIKTSINNLIALNRYNGAKNLIPRPYHGEKQYGTTRISNGITWTVEDDGTITVNGTATSTSYYNILYTSKIFDAERTYITSINASNLDGNGSINLFQRCDITEQSTHDVINMSMSYDGENNRIFVPENNGEYDIDVIGLYVRPNVTINNAKVKIMVRAIEDVDSTYVPYAKNNKQLTDEIIPANAFNELGSKNLLPYPYLSKTNTTNGLTFTDNGDGTITVNGTATAETTYTLYQGAGLNLIQGQEYIATGCPTGGSLATYRIQWANSAWSFQKNDTGGGVTFSLNNPSTDYLGYIRIDIQNGTVCDNLVFKPMIRPASIVDDTYVPYAMTNRELTEYHTTVAKTFTQSSADVATYLRNANTSGYTAFGYSYNRTMITVNAIFTIKASGNALYKSDGTTATSGNENWELIKIPNFPYSKAIPDGPLSGLLFLNTTDLKDLYCRKSGNDLIFTISATDYASFVGKGIRLSATIMLK